MGRIYDGRAMLALNGAVGHDGCVRYEEGACDLYCARGAHTSSGVGETERQSPLPSGRGRRQAGDETGRLSGLLVAVLDRGSVFPIRRAIRQNGLDKR